MRVLNINPSRQTNTSTNKQRQVNSPSFGTKFCFPRTAEFFAKIKELEDSGSKDIAGYIKRIFDQILDGMGRHNAEPSNHFPPFDDSVTIDEIVVAIPSYRLSSLGPISSTKSHYCEIPYFSITSNGRETTVNLPDNPYDPTLDNSSLIGKLQSEMISDRSLA